MLFTSYEFLIFLFITTVAYYLWKGPRQWLVLLFAGIWFYGRQNPAYLFFLGGTILTVYAGTRGMERLDGRRKRRPLLLAVTGVNLFVLWLLKYTDLLFDGLMIPLGISFYTFQALSYLIDVYRGTEKAEKNIGKVALFAGFFPQLIQGPISRYSDLSKTLFEEHRFSWNEVSLGLQRILWGYFKKLVIADRILAAVQTLLLQPETYRGIYVLAGMVFYAIELYADFTGGIDIVIGIAQILGIRVKENFIRPYFSKSVKEYWTRWHISMGTWFRDYVFYPVSVSKPLLKISKWARKNLGNAIGKRVPVYLSALIVWSATGIWHGRGWNFLAWGIGNCLIILISGELEPLYRRFHKRYPVKDHWLFRTFQILRTIFLMSCLRLFDCYGTVRRTFVMFASIFTDFLPEHFSAGTFLKLGLDLWDYGILMAGVALMITVSLMGRTGSVREKIRKQNGAVRFLIWYGLLIVVLLFGCYGQGYEAVQFIYRRY